MPNHKNKRQSETNNSSPIGAEGIAPKGHRKIETGKKIQQLDKFSEGKRPVDEYNKWEFGFSAVVAFSALVTAIQGCSQWYFMNKQLDEMNNNSIQADKMLKSTEQLAKSAIDSLNLSREQFNQANRPYIIPVVQPSRGLVDEPVQAKLTLINYGKTVGLNTVVHGHIFMGNDALQDAKNWFMPFEAKSLVNGIPIPPGIPNEMNKERMVHLHTTRRMSIADGRLIAENDGIVVIVARIQYQSTMGVTHHTDVCYSLNKSWEATLCVTNNTVD